MRLQRTQAILTLLATILLNHPGFSQDTTRKSWAPIRRNVTQSVLEGRDSVTIAAGLTPLRSTVLPMGTQEIRIWIGEGIGIPEDLYRIVRQGHRVTGEWIQFWSEPYYQDNEPDVTALMEYTLAGQCRSIGKSGRAGACHTRLVGEPDWKGILQRIERAQVWTLPDESELPQDSVWIMDGWSILVEVRDGAHYRAYHHANPDGHQHPVSKHAAEIAEALWTLNPLLRKGDNWRRYRGQLITGPGRRSFTSCGDSTEWEASGPAEVYLGWIYNANRADTMVHPLTRRYIEARGMRQFPGLRGEIELPYTDQVYFDTVYALRPWNPEACNISNPSVNEH